MEYCEHNVDDLAIEVVGQNWTSEVSSLFLEDWEVGRVASSCHLSMDLLCQEMRDVCKVSSEPLDYPRSFYSECQRSSLVELSRQQSFFSPWSGCDIKKIKFLVRDLKEKERVRRALLRCAG